MHLFYMTSEIRAPQAFVKTCLLPRSVCVNQVGGCKRRRRRMCVPTLSPKLLAALLSKVLIIHLHFPRCQRSLSVCGAVLWEIERGEGGHGIQKRCNCLWLLSGSITACVVSPDRVTFTPSHHVCLLKALPSPPLPPAPKLDVPHALVCKTLSAALNSKAPPPMYSYVNSLRRETPHWATSSRLATNQPRRATWARSESAPAKKKKKTLPTDARIHIKILYENTSTYLPAETKSNGQETRRTSLSFLSTH